MATLEPRVDDWRVRNSPRAKDDFESALLHSWSGSTTIETVGPVTTPMKSTPTGRIDRCAQCQSSDSGAQLVGFGR